MLDQDRAETAMLVNFWALTRLVKGAIRQMVPARAGRIVGMGSIAALHGMSGNSAYAATKGAMLSYVRTAAVELARKGVTVNFVAPGYVDTELMEPYAAFRRALEKQIPVGRFAQPGEIAALVNHLMAPEAAYITGSVLAVDGGLSAGIALGA
jgi:NAD(P)-dependent dehydrogenase (short-subunit alcohol dehydrogenase family)